MATHIREEILFNGRRGEVYNAINDSMPDGISRSDLCKQLDITTSSAYTNINHLNKFQSKFRIVSKNQKYIIKDRNKTSKKDLPKSKDLIVNDPKFGSEKFVSFKTMEKVMAMPHVDTFDILEMLKKSYYYKKSAEALLEAHELTHLIKAKLHTK